MRKNPKHRHSNNIQQFLKLESPVNVEDQEDLYKEELKEQSNKNRMKKYEITYQQTSIFLLEGGNLFIGN